MKQSSWTGAIVALIGLFPMAFLVTLLWRFPMPMGGYESGLDAALKSPVALVFYGLFGGFVVVPAFGAFAGWMAFRMAGGGSVTARRLSVVYGLSCALIACLILSVLDKIIGAW